MKTIDYEELLKQQGPISSAIDQYKRYFRLRDALRNLETLNQLADAAAKERKTEDSE